MRLFTQGYNILTRSTRRHSLSSRRHLIELDVVCSFLPRILPHWNFYWIFYMGILYCLRLRNNQIFLLWFSWKWVRNPIILSHSLIFIYFTNEEFLECRFFIDSMNFVMRELMFFCYQYFFLFSIVFQYGFTIVHDDSVENY